VKMGVIEDSNLLNEKERKKRGEKGKE